jgi:hypothetical protein
MPASEPRRAEPLLMWYCLTLAGLAIALFLRGPAAPHIDDDLWRWTAPCAVVGTALLGWLFKRKLTGRTFQLRGSQTAQIIDDGWSWLVGILAAGTLMMIVPYDAAYGINRVIGLPYTDVYTVAETYTTLTHGVHSSACYGILIERESDPDDAFRLCVSEAEQDKATVGRKMEVRERRSRYIDQMIGYDWLAAVD